MRALQFFVVELEIYTLAQPARRRLFRPNISPVEATKRWVHTRVPHPNPDALVKARPDTIEVAGIVIRTRPNGSWAYNGDLCVWVYEITCSEDHAAKLNLSRWAAGPYRGDPVDVYRSEVHCD
jgi:hypothetical protein